MGGGEIMRKEYRNTNVSDIKGSFITLLLPQTPGQSFNTYGILIQLQSNPNVKPSERGSDDSWNYQICIGTDGAIQVRQRINGGSWSSPRKIKYE